MDDAPEEMQNPFPSPPSHYTRYTSQNLKLAALLSRRRNEDTTGRETQSTLLADQRDVPDWPLTSLEPPRADWIAKEGHYTIYGDTFFVRESIQPLSSYGVQQLYPEDPSSDRRPALSNILRSLLVSYSKMLEELVKPPPPLAALQTGEEPSWVRHFDWISVLSKNLLAAANELRPVQARVNVENMLKRQLELRKQETKEINEKCDAMEAKLAELRLAATKSTVQQEAPPMDTDDDSFKLPDFSLDDVRKWADEIP